MKFIELNKRISRSLLKLEEDIDQIFIEKIRNASFNSAVIIELGGVSRPVLSLSDKYEYIGIDIDSNFVFDQYYNEFYCQSVEDKIDLKADLIFSKYLMEHVKNVKISYENQFTMLNVGGRSIHLYPLGYHPFSLANKLLGNNIARKLIPILRKGSEIHTGYPAYYSLGNAYKLERFFRKKGINAKFKYHYGALDYFTFFIPLAFIIFIFNSISRKFNLKIFASNVIVEFEK